MSRFALIFAFAVLVVLGVIWVGMHLRPRLREANRRIDYLTSDIEKRK